MSKLDAFDKVIFELRFLITLLTALAISAVAAFYSIVGLMAIFSAS